MNKDLRTDYQALYDFEKALRKYCDELLYDTKTLVRETDGVVGSVWAGDQANRFKDLVDENTHAINKDVEELLRLADVIHEAAMKLEQARAKNIL